MLEASKVEPHPRPRPEFGAQSRVLRPEPVIIERGCAFLATSSIYKNYIVGWSANTPREDTENNSRRCVVLLSSNKIDSTHAVSCIMFNVIVAIPGQEDIQNMSAQALTMSGKAHEGNSPP